MKPTTDPAYGTAVQVASLVQRVTAANASPFTFAGTGTYIVGDRRVAVIDPGPDDAGHTEALLRALEGRTVTHICITHTHNDHSPASRALADATGAPTLGFGPHPAADAGRHSAEASAVQEEPGDWDFIPDGVLGSWRRAGRRRLDPRVPVHPRPHLEPPVLRSALRSRPYSPATTSWGGPPRSSRRPTATSATTCAAWSC